MAISGQANSKRRAPTPSLLFGNLSSLDTNEPYLSPPISTLRMSPPPRQDARDYFSSRANKSDKRKRRSKQRACSPLIHNQVEDIKPAEVSPAYRARLENLKVENGESCQIKKERRVLGKSLTLPLSFPTIEPSGQYRWWQLQNTTISIPSQARARFVTTASNDLDDVDESPAVNSLRRITRSSTQTPESNLRDLRHLSRTLTNKINSVFALKETAPGPHVVIKKVDISSGMETQRATLEQSSTAYQHEGYQLSKPNVRKRPRLGLPTPTSITLRKASENAPSKMTIINESTVHRTTLDLDTLDLLLSSSPNLVGFQSKRLDETQPTIVSSVSSPQTKTLPNSQLDLLPQNTLVKDPDTCTGSRVKSLSRASFSITDRRHSSVAETALTITDFYPAPGTFAKPKSRTNSISHNRATFRTSVVQLLSRNSLHEIIWREEGTPSSEESSSLNSLKQKNQLSPKHSSLQTDGSDKSSMHSPTHVSPPVVKEIGFSSITKSSTEPVESSPDSFNAHKRLFTWSWRDPDNEIPNRNQMALPKTRSRSTEFSITTITSEYRNSSLPSVQFFPPLDNRRSTSEWRKKPLVDLNDPVAGRSEQSGVFSRNQSMELDRGLEILSSNRTKLGNLNLYLIEGGKTGGLGKMGSSVGASSRARFRKQSSKF